MKRRDVLPVVVLTAALSFQKEHESSNCDVLPCVDGNNVAMPEPQHSHQEFPEYEIVGDELCLMKTSPLVSYALGTPEFFRFVAENRIDLGTIRWEKQL